MNSSSDCNFSQEVTKTIKRVNTAVSGNEIFHASLLVSFKYIPLNNVKSQSGNMIFHCYLQKFSLFFTVERQEAYFSLTRLLRFKKKRRREIKKKKNSR